MKKIFKMMFAVVAGIAALTACTNEPEEEGITPDVPSASEYVIVKVGMHEVNRSFTDAEGIKWNVGDQIKYAGGVVLTSEALTAEDIEDEGYTANFKFPAALNEVNRTGWFSSTKNHPSNNDEVEFTLGTGNGNIYSQAAAGEMNARYLFLHSGTGLVDITKDESPVVKMDVVGSIFRILPYTELYNDEEIKSVELTGKNANGIVGTVAYDRGTGSYRGVNDINWQKSNLVRISLDEPFALTNANSRETSKGIYMALARTTEAAPIEGYTYTVKTNKATYTFSSDENLVIGENEVKNVYLKLENGARVDDTARKGDLQYVGDLNAASSKLSSNGITDFDGGYWYAQTKDTGSDAWVGRDGADNTAYYDSVVFECIDNATGEVAEWLTVNYGGAGGTHWLITATPNEATTERSATVTATFPEFVNGYYTVENCKTKTVTVTQAATGSLRVITFSGGANNSTHNLKSTSYTNHNLGYMLANIDGTDNREWSKYYTLVEFKCVSKEDYDNGIYDNEVDWLTCGYATNANGIFDCLWWAQVEANSSSEARSAVIISTWPEMEGFVYKDNIRQHVAFINQAGGQNISASFSNVLTEAVSKDGAEGVTVATLEVVVNGEIVADITGHCTVSINGGATNVAVAADGTITANIPANSTTNEKTYTISVKNLNNTVIATAEFTQEAGDGGGNTELVAPADSYNVTPVVTWGGGWGFPANTKHEGNYAFIRDASKDGAQFNYSVIEGNEGTDAAYEVANSIVAYVFRSSVPSSDEIAKFGMQSKTPSATAVTARARWCGGTQIDVAFTTTDANSVTKVTGYAADGSELGYWIIWTD